MFTQNPNGDGRGVRNTGCGSISRGDESEDSTGEACYAWHANVFAKTCVAALRDNKGVALPAKAETTSNVPIR